MYQVIIWKLKEDSLELNSDRSPIVLALSEHIISESKNPGLANKSIDWNIFRITLEERVNLSVPVRTQEQLDFEVEKLISDIQHSAWKNTPEINRKLEGNNYPKQIRELLSEKTKSWEKMAIVQIPSR